jgi:Ca2+-binding RTX toxin-like protein
LGLRRATFAAASGERNAVTVTLDGTVVRIADAGAPLTVGAIKVRAEIDGGDGNDTLTATSVAGFVGGTGDDVIHGGERGDSIDPGPGADTVMAGGGGDFLYADTDLPPVADRYDGGEGEDQISYLNRRTGVRVDLAAGVGGEPGEDDALTGLEDVTGSVASDVLAGDDGPNRFLTRASQGDRILGRGGDDRIEGSSHGDRIDGGPGDDHIRTEGGADRVDGGPGRDEVLVRFTRESGTWRSRATAMTPWRSPTRGALRGAHAARGWWSTTSRSACTAGR